jgi:hypothetical protein
VKVATPPDRAAVRLLPWSAAVPWLPRVTVTVCELSVVMRLPKASSSCTIGCVAKAVPAVAVADGCCVTTSWLAAAGLMLNDVEVADVSPGELAVSVKPVPAWSIDRPVKVTSPLLVSSVEVPLMAMLPGLAVTDTGTTAVTVARLPNRSYTCTVTAGLRAAPAVASVGCCPKARWSGSAAPTTMGREVAVKLPASVVKAMSIVSARS